MAPPPPPPPPDPAVLRDKLLEEFLIRFPQEDPALVEEFLLRLTPEDPELLARAALVSRQWYRVVTGPSFRRRFRELHRSKPPLLGYVLTIGDSIQFVSLSTFRPRRTLSLWRAVSSSHGRVLLQRRFPPRVRTKDVNLSVWDPITGKQQDLPVLPLRPTPNIYNWDAAVVCAVGDGCNHLHCHFNVVFVGRHNESVFSCVYSSEAGSWSDPAFSSEALDNYFVPGSFVLVRCALYTMCGARNEIFKYDLGTHQMCNISVSVTPGPGVIGHGGSRLIATEDGRLGFAKAINSTLHLWLMENGRLEKSGAIDLCTLLPADAIRDQARPLVITFADTGAGVVFLQTCVGYFTIDLKSGSCKKVGENLGCYVVPFVSFCTPAQVASVAISSNEASVACIAVSTDEGSGSGVAVSADEGAGAGGMCQVPEKLKLEVQGPLNQDENE